MGGRLRPKEASVDAGISTQRSLTCMDPPVTSKRTRIGECLAAVIDVANMRTFAGAAKLPISMYSVEEWANSLRANVDLESGSLNETFAALLAFEGSEITPNEVSQHSILGHLASLDVARSGSPLIRMNPLMPNEITPPCKGLITAIQRTGIQFGLVSWISLPFCRR